MLESISDAYYAVDRDWRVVMFNGSAEDFFGQPRSEILGRDFWEIYTRGRDTEFASNAVKYGSLSTPNGRVEVRWTTDGGVLRLTWRELDGPPVSPPTLRGFGARLLEQDLSEELRGTVRLDFRPEGLVCSVEAALEA